MNQDTDREILLALLRSEQVTAVSPESWHAVTHLAHKQRVGPLLFRQLDALQLTNQVPPDCLQALRSEYLNTAYRNTQVYYQLSNLFERFQRADIPGILLKGAYLAEHIYGNIGVRPMGDVDILVRERDLARVEEIVLEMGFTGPDEADEQLEEREHLSYTRAETGLRIEFHWNLLNALNFGIHVNVDSLWERSQATLVANIPVREMSPEDQVLHLCVHMSKHGFSWFALSSICDLTETLRCFQETIDWERVCERARQWDAERCVYTSLWLAKTVLNAQVPVDLMNALARQDLGMEYVTLAEKHFFFSDEQSPRPYTPTKNFAWFWVAKGLPRKVSLLGNAFFPSRQALATMYPAAGNSPRIFVYYLVRLKDLIIRYRQVAWDLYRANEKKPQVEHWIQTVALERWLFPGRSSSHSSKASLADPRAGR